MAKMENLTDSKSHLDAGIMDSCSVMLRMSLNVATLDVNAAIPQNAKNKIAIGPALLLLGIHPILLLTYLLIHFHCCFVSYES